MRFSVESWSPEYGSAIEGEALDDVSEHVDATIERALADWGPITPPASPRPDRILFVDGVRRVDARLWIHDGDRAHPGICASVAAGVVECVATAATVTEWSVDRVMIAPDGTPADGVVTRHATYEHVTVADADPASVNLAIHDRMTALEQRVATDHGCELVVFDGPLRGRNDPCAVGYVKTQHVQYLPDDVVDVLGRLADGQRTPLVLIGDRGAWARRSWYLRLPGPRSHPLSGIVRCEVPALGPVAAAVARADLVSACLPRFASQVHKESRAPQNLTPIAGLEHRLRHLLGDPVLLDRSLRIASASGF
ncbi:MAG: hypothetical protein ABW219_09945 [Ilumatobacteraceae bacterium]